MCCAQVFQQAYIPRRLEEVDDHEGDFDRLAGSAAGAAGRHAPPAEGIYYQTLAGMRADMSGAAGQPAIVAAAAQLRHGDEGAPDMHASTSGEDHSGSSDDEEEGGDAAGHVQQVRMPAAAAALDGEQSGRLAHADGESREHDMAAAHQKSGSSDTGSSSGEASEAGSRAAEDQRPGWQERSELAPEAEKAARKEHKAAVKEANRERRKSKLKKHVKKRAVNKHKRK